MEPVAVVAFARHDAGIVDTNGISKFLARNIDSGDVSGLRPQKRVLLVTATYIVTPGDGTRIVDGSRLRCPRTLHIESHDLAVAPPNEATLVAAVVVESGCRAATVDTRGIRRALAIDIVCGDGSVRGTDKSIRGTICHQVPSPDFTLAVHGTDVGARRTGHIESRDAAVGCAHESVYNVDADHVLPGDRA